MDWYKKIKPLIRKEWVLLSLLLLAFLLRIVGVGYGLPLAVVNDEAPYTFAALLMIQLHTILPALHPEFQTVLYYPPYLSYILLVPFSVILGLQYLLWHGAPALFQAHVLLDLSPFFVAARLVTVLLGTASVYLVYRIAEKLFRSRVAASAAAFLLATSVLHEALSMVGRQWLPVSFVFLVVLFLLVKDTWSVRRRYLTAFAAAGIGMGISAISALACLLIGIYYLCFDAPKFRHIMRDVPLLMLGALIFFALAVLAWLLYHGGHNFLGTISLHQQKTLVDFLMSPWSAIRLIVFSEPVLVGLSALGMIFCALSAKRIGTLIAAFFAVYVAAFYVLFYFEGRFVVPLVPFLSILGGYAISRLWGRRFAAFVCILLVIPLPVAGRLSYLSMQSDTRALAREWVLENLKPNDRVLVFSSALHISTQKAAVKELRSIEPTALRKIDEADEAMDRRDVPYVLNNLTSISESVFAKNLPQYARQHDYTYVVIELRSLPGMPAMAESLASLTKDASVAVRFDGFEAPMSLWESAFTEPFIVLFQPKLLGPNIVIYRL